MVLKHRVSLGCGLMLLASGCGSSDGDAPGYVSLPGADAGTASVDAGEFEDAHEDSAAFDGAGSGQQDSGPDSCPPPPSCNVPVPDLGEPRGWNHSMSQLTSLSGPRRHRGRDLFVLEGQDPWILGKFAYGVFDDDVKDEDVDVYLLRDCGSGQPWEFLGTFRTTSDGEHPTVEGVEDTGGRIYVRLSATGAAPLGRGRHRILMVLAGDLSTTDQYVEVVSPGVRVVVTDIDGTLTASEYAAATDVVGLPLADVHDGAVEMMNVFAERGYHIFYLTARPAWMMPLTREWLAEYGFPEGVLHTTLTGFGASGGAAVEYKTAELADLANKTGVTPAYAFGNKDSDVQAYANAGIDPEGCYYYELGGDTQGGTDHGDYAALVPVAASSPLACQ